jgi:hypothetical protein
MLGLSTEADLVGPGALSLDPDSTAEVRHVIGAVRWPSEEPVAEIMAGDGILEITGKAGAIRQLPFFSAFLRRPAPSEAQSA